MKVIIAGSRDFALVPEDYALYLIDTALQRLGLPVTEVVSGKATGIDTWGEVWAARQLVPIPVKEFPADWKTWKKAAGHIRNQQMGNYADAAVIIWDGFSRGSRHMYNYMNELKKPCFMLTRKVPYQFLQPSIHTKAVIPNPN